MSDLGTRPADPGHVSDLGTRPADPGHVLRVEPDPAAQGHTPQISPEIPGPADDACGVAGSVEVTIAKPPATRRLDLASGQNVRVGFEGVDIWPGAQHVVNLQQYPWPFEDESVLEVNCSHYIEHIPMEMIVGRRCRCCGGHGIVRFEGSAERCSHCQDGVQAWPAKDALFAFFDECYRILVPDGWLHVVVPAHRSDRAFQDPTHRRFITAQTFAYMNQEWRRINRLDHYNVDCNFVGNANPVVDQTLTLRHPDVAQQMIQRNWNTVIDWTASMQKKPRMTVKVFTSP